MTHEGDAASEENLLERLFEAYRLPILNYLYRLVGDSAYAEELTQEVFIRAYRSLGRLERESNHRAWLYRIATNLAMDHLRRRRLLAWLPIREAEPLSNSPGEDLHAVETTLAAQEGVQCALAKLPPAYRAALILFSVQGYTIHEIAQMLGISEGAVKTRLSRARQMFRKVYGAQT